MSDVMTPQQFMRFQEFRRRQREQIAQQLAQQRGPPALLTVGEPMIGQGNVQMSVGEPVIEPRTREQMLVEMLRQRARQPQFQQPQGVLASLAGSGE
jgi:hypothetical protein